MAPVFGTNTYLLVDGARCVIVDPGGGVAPAVVREVEAHGLRPVGLVATHGHLDHVWDAAALCERFGVPLHVHEADAYRLDDPFGSIESPPGPLTAALVASGLEPERYARPPVRPVTTGPDGRGRLVFGEPGIVVDVVHAPGHTAGSWLLLPRRAGAPDGPAAPVVLTGDVLFAGTIGRTDLPGADPGAMARTLRLIAAADGPLADARGARPAGPSAPSGPSGGDLRVLPGHGPETTLAAELARNPYLAR